MPRPWNCSKLENKIRGELNGRDAGIAKAGKRGREAGKGISSLLALSTSLL
jgi:hypothetical protein